MKRKQEWPAWTPFQQAYYKDEAQVIFRATRDLREGDEVLSYRNSRYQVDLEPFNHPQLGRMVKIGIKDHWRTHRHDWRDFQRIKNELVGEEFDAIELYPSEDRLVDTANQFYLFVFLDTRVPLGWQGRLVAEGNYLKARQRPFDPRPADCLTSEQLQAIIEARIEAQKEKDKQEQDPQRLITLEEV